MSKKDNKNKKPSKTSNPSKKSSSNKKSSNNDKSNNDKSNNDSNDPKKPKKTFLIIYGKNNKDQNKSTDTNDLDDENLEKKNKNKKIDDDFIVDDDDDDILDSEDEEEEFIDDDFCEDENNEIEYEDSFDDDDEEYNENDFIQDEIINNQIENKYNKRNRDRLDDFDDQNESGGRLNNLFHIMGILTNPRDGNEDNPDFPGINPRKKKKKSHKDEFLDYFKNAKDLIPINKEIKTLKDLIELGESYDPNDKTKYVINLKALNKCVDSLKELDSMIGMTNVKNMIIDLIFFRLQNFEDDTNELWHLVIQGDPGCGKTEISKIIAKIYFGLGIIKQNKFTQAKRSDLIGKYLGHTAKQTQEVFDSASGGVLFIDEAYSLGNPEGRDSFAKECIDTINLNLTEKRDTVVFIAGYKEQLEESFFSYNPGLNRRFKMRLTVDKYNASDLREIFIKKIKENKWNIFEENEEKNLPLSFFERNRDCFKYNGGDMENLWHLTKIVHARRIFGKSNDLIKKITLDDLNSGFKLYEENEEFKNRENNKNLQNYIKNTMYC